MRFGRPALVAGAVLLAAVAGTVLTVAANAATGGTVSWFPAVEHDPLWWTAGSTAGVAAAGLLVWHGQRWYDAGIRELIPAVQRPESWIVERPAEVAKIVAAVRAGGTVGVTTAIHGAGGFNQEAEVVVAHELLSSLKNLGGFPHFKPPLLRFGMAASFRHMINTGRPCATNNRRYARIIRCRQSSS